MNKTALKILFFLLLMTLLSCGKERLILAHQPKTVNQLNGNRPLDFSYKIDETQIDEYAKNTGKFPIFGKLFQAIAVVLANTTINNQGGHELDLSSIEVDLSTLSKIDFKMLEWLKLNSLLIEIRNSKSKDNLNFIDKIEIYAKLDQLPTGVPLDEEGRVRLLYYDRKIQSLGCEEKCLMLEQENVDWKSILESNKNIAIHPRIVINSVPRSTMKLAGSVDFSIKLNLKF